MINPCTSACTHAAYMTDGPVIRDRRGRFVRSAAHPAHAAVLAAWGNGFEHAAHLLRRIVRARTPDGVMDAIEAARRALASARRTR